MLRRAGLGFWPNLDVTRYAGWEEFLRQNGKCKDYRITYNKAKFKPLC